MSVEMDRDGGRVLILGKITQRTVCVLSILKFACAFVQANKSFFFTLDYPVVGWLVVLSLTAL